MDYRIVADSSSDLRGLEGVAFASVPLKIVTDEREFTDDGELDIDEMIAYLTSYRGRSGTSCPSVGEFLTAFGDAEGVFVLCITGALSGCYQAAVEAKKVYEQEHPGRRVCCIDTRSTGPEMALLAEKLQELIQMGLGFEEIEEEIRRYQGQTHLLFSLESLKNLSRNGRVSLLIAKACGILGIRIVGQASDEGTLQPLHKSRGAKKAVEHLLREMERLGYRGGKVRIDHCRNEDGARALSALLEEAFPGCAPRIGPAAGLCSFYAEEGGIMVGFEG